MHYFGKAKIALQKYIVKINKGNKTEKYNLFEYIIRIIEC